MTQRHSVLSLMETEEDVHTRLKVAALSVTEDMLFTCRCGVMLLSHITVRQETVVRAAQRTAGEGRVASGR